MSRERLADAFEELAASLTIAAERVAQVAHEMRAGPEQAGTAPARAPQVAPAADPSTPLGACPVHGVAWTVKAGGISKNGKPYPAFWKCAQRDGDVWCAKRPTKAWADSHPIPLEAAA